MNTCNRSALYAFFFLFYFCQLGKAQCPQLNWGSAFKGMNTIPVKLISDPIVGTNDDGRLEVFVIGEDGALWHSWQLQENIKEWSAWASFGSPPNSPLVEQRGTIPKFAVTKDKDGRLQVFATNGSVWQIGQLAKNVNWNTWRSLGKPSSPSGQAEGIWSIANQDGRIELFIQNSSNHSLQHMWQLADAFSFNGIYTEFGWPSNASIDVETKLTLALDLSGRIELATISGGFVQIRRQRIQNAANADWENWQSLNVPNTTIKFDPYSISLGKNADGRLELVAEGQNHNLWHTWQTTPQNNNPPQWTGQWANFGSPVFGANIILDQQLVQGVKGCLTLIALCQYNGVNESKIGFINQKQPSIDWRTWAFISRQYPRLQTTGALAVAKGREGELYLFVRNGDIRGGLVTAISSK
jgi:hypothetical protein